MSEHQQFSPGDEVEVRYLDDDDVTEVIGYRGIVQSPAKRPGDYIVRVTEVLDDAIEVRSGDTRAPILGHGVTMRKVD